MCQAGHLRARVPQLLSHLVVEGGRRHLPALIEVAARHAGQIRIEGAVEEAVLAGPPRLYNIYVLVVPDNNRLKL